MKTTVSFSGAAGVTSYSFPHNLGYDPNYVQVTPIGPDSPGIDGSGALVWNFEVSHDAANITIDYFSNPNIGINNLIFSVEALVITTFDASGNPRCD